MHIIDLQTKNVKTTFGKHGALLVSKIYRAWMRWKVNFYLPSLGMSLGLNIADKVAVSVQTQTKLHMTLHSSTIYIYSKTRMALHALIIVYHIGI